MKDLWQRLTVDWPCAAGDWLWLNLVLMPLATLARMRRRHVLHLVGLLILLVFAQQLLLMDLTFLFGLDLALLMEISAAVFAITLREQIATSVRVMRAATVRRIGRIRPRLRQIATRAEQGMLPRKADDEDGAFAFA